MGRKRHARPREQANPSGPPAGGNAQARRFFRTEKAAIPAPKDGEVLLRILYLSLDPYLRGRMNASKSYAKRWRSAMSWRGGTVGRGGGIPA